MKKIVLLASSLLLACGAWAQSLSWAKLIDSANSECPNAIIQSADGAILSLSNFGSAVDGSEVRFGDQVVGKGTATSAASDNYNALIMKTDTNGDVIWSVYSKDCDITINSSNIAATADGGALVSLKVRYPSGYADRVPGFVDADGSEWAFETWNKGYRVQYMAVIKIDGNGAIQWIKKFDIDTKPEEAATYYTQGTPDAIDPYAIAEDNSGNIYVGGHYRKTLILTDKDNRTYTLTPHNIASDWDGDSQDSNGDMFLLKLDSEGNYVDHIVSKGVIKRDQICDLLIDNGKIYFAGNMQSNDGTTEVTIDGKAVTPTTMDDIVVGCVDIASFTTDWVNIIKAFPASNGKHTTQVKNLQKVDNKFYVMGHIVGGFGSATASSADISSTGTMQEGFVVEFNGTDGSYQGGVVNGKSIGGYYGVFTANNSIYAFGYTLGTIFLDQYEPSTWNRINSTDIITGGGMCTAWDCLVIGSNLYTFTRCNKGETNFYNSDVTTSSEGWGSIVSCWDITNIQTAVETTGMDAGTRYIGEQGGVKIISNEAVDVNIYNTLGQVVYSGNIAAGTNFVSLPQGIYVANNNKVVVR